jgi:hypothetical protein
MICNDDYLQRINNSLTAFFVSSINPEILKALTARLEAAEEVILDAEENLGVVNPLLVQSWRYSAGKEPTKL